MTSRLKLAVGSLNQGDDQDARKSIQRMLLIDRYKWTAAAAVGVLYLLEEKNEARQLLEDLLERFPSLSPVNPLVGFVLRGPEDLRTR